MDDQTAKIIKKDFLTWSGGFPPESDYQIYTYIDAAKPVDVADAELWVFLRSWQDEDDPDDRQANDLTAKTPIV